jgi:MerR family transcriptional regulator, light-induced transcriptional regulator
MLALARGWERGPGPMAVVACAPSEQHTLGLIAFGLALRNRGWAIVYLGADSPVAMIDEAVLAQGAPVAVVSAVDAERFVPAVDELRALARETRLLLGGAGATDASVASASSDSTPIRSPPPSS